MYLQHGRLCGGKWRNFLLPIVQSCFFLHCPAPCLKLIVAENDRGKTISSEMDTTIYDPCNYIVSFTSNWPSLLDRPLLIVPQLDWLLHYKITTWETTKSELCAKIIFWQICDRTVFYATRLSKTKFYLSSRKTFELVADWRKNSQDEMAMKSLETIASASFLRLSAKRVPSKGELSSEV